jgi:hypothetical protein
VADAPDAPRATALPAGALAAGSAFDAGRPADLAPAASRAADVDDFGRLGIGTS